MDDARWYGNLRERLESAYLAADDPPGGSGFHGDRERWERHRCPIVAAVDRGGTFLDVGCANGLLMESVVEWSRERGHRIEPYGLDLSPALADVARKRLPRWADRIFVGNVIDWSPPGRFDYVRTELGCVPERMRRHLVERLVGEVAVDDGTLIVCSYGSSRRPEPAEPVAELLRTWGHRVAGEARHAENGVVVTEVAWTRRSRAFP
jgi:SAM-dependent methyltransferase